MPQLRSEGGEPSARATPGLLLPSYTTPWDAAPAPSGSGECFGASKPGRKRPKRDFRCINLSINTHHSGVDPNALLCRPTNAHPALSSIRGHVLMVNRYTLIVDCLIAHSTGTDERDAAWEMAADRLGAHQKTIVTDKKYDTIGFVAQMRLIAVTPHLSQYTCCPWVPPSRGGGACATRTSLSLSTLVVASKT